MTMSHGAGALRISDRIRDVTAAAAPFLLPPAPPLTATWATEEPVICRAGLRAGLDQFLRAQTQPTQLCEDREP